MTVTIEVQPELAARWQEIAQREGRPLETLLAEAMEERAALLDDEDAEDLQEARRVLAQTDRSDFRTLAELREAMKERAQ